MRQSLSFNLAASSAYIPQQQILSGELDQKFSQERGWTEKQFSIQSRYWVAHGETSSFMAARAAENALKEANWDIKDLDVIIGACGVMEQPIPSTATVAQQKLGLGDSGIPAFDVNATCLSFLLALERAVIGLYLGQWKRALIFSSDIASVGLDFSNPEASAIFGDGAGAILIEEGDQHEMLAYRLETYGNGKQYCQLRSGGTRLTPENNSDEFTQGSKFEMDGASVFKLTARKFPTFIKKLFDAEGVDLKRINSVIPHQASAVAIAHLKKHLGNKKYNLIDIFSTYGNQIATSLPHALHHARLSGELSPGKSSLLIGSSAGISLGGTVIRW